MTVWVECPNCGGKVEIPDAAPSDFPCPMCKYALLTSRPLERTRRLPSDSAPSWMRPWGYAFTIIGGLAFVAGAIGEYFREPDPPMVAVIVSGLLNPIFFIGLPLGIYWVRRSKKSQPLAAIDSGSKIASHVLAVIAGLILVMIGLLLSVPMFGLPLGIPISLAGVLICLWGLFGTTTQKPVAPPHV